MRCSFCGYQTIKRGVRLVSKIPRMWCPACKKWQVNRGVEKHLRAAKGFGVSGIGRLAANGLSLPAIQKKTGRSALFVKRRLSRIVVFAKQRHALHPPGPGRGWALVDPPASAHMGVGKAAIGSKRNTRRLLGWATGPDAADVLRARLGGTQVPHTALDSDWLTRSLGTSARTAEEAEERLWVILAISNGWKFTEELVSGPQQLKAGSRDP